MNIPLIYRDINDFLYIVLKHFLSDSSAMKFQQRAPIIEQCHSYYLLRPTPNAMLFSNYIMFKD